MSLEDTEPAVRGCDAQPGWQRGGCASRSGRGLVYETLPAIAIFLIVFRHAVLLNKKAPVVYHSKSHKKRRWWVMCEVRGTRCEPSLCSFARCFVTRRRGSWAIVMGITKKNRIIVAAARGRRCVVAWQPLPIVPSGTSNAGTTQDRVIPRVFPGNTWPCFPLPVI